MIFAATHDALSRRVSNRLTALIAVVFFPLAWVEGMPLIAMPIHLGAGIGLLVLGFCLFSFGFFGGGDAKLLAAAGIWFGIDGLVQFLAFTVITGGLLALAVLAWSVISIDAELRGIALSRRAAWLKPSVPYGYAIAAGAILAFPDSWWARAFTP